MFDLIIIGAGPAGLAASIFASRFKLSHLVFGIQLGGLVSISTKIENYPGFSSITGIELTQKMVDHVKSLGGQIRQAEVVEIRQKNSFFVVETADDEEFESKTIILAPGAKHRKLNILGEEKFLGKGVSYCATCDAAFFPEKTVAVVGGSDSAAAAALHLAEVANKVYFIYRGEKLKAEPIWIERVLANEKIEIIYNTNVLEVKGGELVEEIVLDKPYNSQTTLKLDGLFIEIGQIPSTTLASSLGVELDEKNYIKVDSQMSANIKGVFAAGEATTACQYLRQILDAATTGATATKSVFNYLKKETAQAF